MPDAELPRQLAQLNIARLRAALDSPELADFVAALDDVNASAESASGFVWRLKDESGNATSIRPWGEDVVVNLSVWDSVESLRAWMYAGQHLELLRRRREFFVPLASHHLVLWWVPEAHRPDLDEAHLRLSMLDRLGPSAEAFTLQRVFPSE
ncbi:MAG: DUF3291 domain-containing protein [Candidatus Nanopelagicales bacterium]